jgi:ribonuclease HI
MQGGTGAVVFGQPKGRGFSFPLGRYAKVIQAEVFAISACADDIQSWNARETRISSDSLAALKALTGC